MGPVEAEVARFIDAPAHSPAATTPQVVSGNGSLAKLGKGAFVLTGCDTYTGPTTIGPSTLAVDGCLTSSPVVVDSKGILHGHWQRSECNRQCERTTRRGDLKGDRFEDREHQLFGEHGFENIVSQVAELEKTLGIYDLGQFTPKL